MPAGKSLLRSRLLLQKGESRTVGGKSKSDLRWDLGTRNGVGLHEHVSQMGDEGEGRTQYLCVSLFALWLRCSRWIRELFSQKNTLTPKGLNTQSGSLKPSNLFIWWFLICCFSASFHCAGALLNPSGLQKDQCWEHILPQQWLGACSQRWKRSLWI